MRQLNLVLWIFHAFASLVANPECLDRYCDLSLLKFRGEDINRARINTHLSDEIRIIYDIQFTCTTQITSILLGLDVRPGNNNRDTFPSFQLWRPTDDQQYMLVDGSVRQIIYTPANVSTTGVYQFPLVPSITATTGDLIAISQPNQGDSRVRCYVIEDLQFDSFEVGVGETMADLSSQPINDELVLAYPVAEMPSCVSSPQLTSNFIASQSLLIADSRLQDQRQIIYPDMIFRCNGSISKWIFTGVGMSGNEFPELQIWRQSIGSDTYIKQGFSQVIANETIPDSNIHEYYLDEPIDFIEGDVFGLFQPRMEDSAVVVYAQRESGPNNYRVEGNVNEPSSTLVLSELMLEGGNDFPLVSLDLISTSTVMAMSSTIETSDATATLNSFSSSELVKTDTNSILGRITTTMLISGVEYYNKLNYQSVVTVTQSETSSSTLQSLLGTPSMSVSNVVLVTVDGPQFLGATIAVSLLIITIVVCTTIVVVILIWRKNVRSSVDIEQSTSCSKDQALYNPTYGGSAELLTSQDSVKHSQTIRSQDVGVYSEISDGNVNHKRKRFDDSNNQQWNFVVPTLDQRRQIGKDFGNFNEAISSIYTRAENVVDDNYHILNQGEFFEESQTYWAPGHDYSSLYEQLATKKFREIPTSHISIGTLLGTGNFGLVMKGTWISPGGSLPVALKTVKQEASEGERIKFLQEAAIMGQFRHPNVIEIHGVVTMNEPLMIVLELMSNGDLHNYLRKLKPVEADQIVDAKQLLSFCRQIASAMEYLSNKGFIHRDLAARNVLLTDHRVCKISDFGMARDLQEENYYISKGGQIPIKWTAPEAIFYKKYSTASDVWSFGTLLYEIWSLGEKPFQNITNQETIRKISNGYRLPPPSGCPRKIYEMMIQCWHPDNSSRPKFSDLKSTLSQADKTLLKVPFTKGEHHPLAFVLGSTVDASHTLYPDLQTLYISDNNNYVYDIAI